MTPFLFDNHIFRIWMDGKLEQKSKIWVCFDGNSIPLARFDE
ncbi:hypothetical protein F0Z19_1829 [Vibrio cyclitrophicus]|nr:hypothetical protein F0Z19_1829 [Vibrio cyclitrophicus]